MMACNIYLATIDSIIRTSVVTAHNITENMTNYNINYQIIALQWDNTL